MTGNLSTKHREVRYRTSADLARIDFTVRSDPGIDIFVRSIRSSASVTSLPPVLLVHGARASSVPSFDLDVPNGSLAADLARAGHPVYLLDARGYGGSTRPDAMNRPPAESVPLTRTGEAVRDIAAVVEQVCDELGVERVALMGWATGSQWMAHYAASEPERVSHLILYNAVWPVTGDWPIGDDLEDPERPGELKTGAIAGYGFATADALLARWNANIPVENPDEWRDPNVAEAYVSAALSTDPSSAERSPASFRTPLGALADTFDLTRGRSPFAPDQITARVLILRSELDFWSREIDRDAPLPDLTSAASIHLIEIPQGTHYAHLDRPERGRAYFLEQVRRFLSR